MKLTRRPLSILVVVIVSLLLQATPAAQDKPQPKEPSRAAWMTDVRKDALAARLERVIPQLMKEGEVPGLSIALIRDAKVMWQRGFGVLKAGTNERVGDSTVFEAASLSKPVFAYGVLKLVDAGKMDLDTPLVKYLPGAYVEGDERVNLITARMVLSHKTGFPNWRPGGEPLKIYFNPGEQFSYSGEGFVYLQKVVEHLTGQPLDLFMRKMVFEPLGMTSSSFVWQDRYENVKATGHNFAGEATERRKPTEANAAGGLHTTTGDYAKFVIAVIKGTGLKRETHREMLSAQSKVDEGCSNCVNNPRTGHLSESVYWGLGWGLQQTGDGKSFWHWGDNNGDVQCYVVASEKTGAGLLVFTNSGNGHSIIPEIIAQAIGGEHPAVAWINYEPYNSPARNLFKAILADGAAAALKRFREAGGKDSTAAALLDEVRMNRIGYALLEKKRIKDAIEVFKSNVAAHPDSFNVYDSLGEAYMLDGDKELAIQNYQKSVELNPNNTNGVQALQKLRGQ